jgi:hypothetical protein
MGNASDPPPPPSGVPTFYQPPGPTLYPPPSSGNRKVVKIVVGIVAGIFLLVMVAVVGLLAFILQMMKSSEPYQHGVQVVTRDARAQQELGTPVKPGYFFSGSVNVSNSSGNADLAIPVHGPKGGGTVYVVAKKSAGQWSYEKLELAVDGQEQRVDLLPSRDW